MNQKMLMEMVNFRPRRMRIPGPWVGHIPFVAWLVKTIKPSTIVELGTYLGNSYLTMCQAVDEAGLQTHCYAIDTWQGDEHSGYYNEGIFEDLDKYHNHHYAGFSRLMRMTFDEALCYFSPQSIELLHIDGLHTYDAVKHDFDSWLPKLAPHAVIMFHDTNVRERGFGVWKLWEEICAQYPLNLEFLHSHGLGVVQLSAGSDSFDLPWLVHGSPEQIIIKKFFTGLGINLLEVLHSKEQELLLLESEKAVKSLTLKVTEYSEANEKLDAMVSELSLKLSEQQERIVEFQNQLAQAEKDKQEHVVELQTQLAQAEKDRRQAYILHSQLSQRDQQLETIQSYLTQREQILQNLNTTLLEIYGSTAWRLIRALWQVRLFLAPHGSIQERFGRSLFGLFRKPIRTAQKDEPEIPPLAQRKLPLNEQKWGVLATPHTLFIGHLISERLAAYGCEVNVSTRSPDEFELDYYIVICPQMFERLPPPEKRIVFQMEQSISPRWFTGEYINILADSLAVLDYSLTNIEFMASINIAYPKVYYLPIGASQTYAAAFPAANKEYDFLFYGDYKSSPRRQRMLEKLSQHYNLKLANEVFGVEMLDIIRRAKAVVNLHYYENSLLETPRIYECLSLGVPVISEKSQDQDDYPDLADVVRFFNDGSVTEMLACAKNMIEEPLPSESIQMAKEKSSQRFKFFFDRFLIGMDLLPVSSINKIEIPEIASKVILSLPETIKRRRNIQSTQSNGCVIFDGIRKTPGWIGCGLSYRALAAKALKSGLTRLTIVEDDALLPEDYDRKIEIINEYLGQNEGEWDLFSGFIASLHPDTKVMKVDEYKGLRFVTINKMTSTVFNIYSEKLLKLLRGWDPDNLDVIRNTIDRYLENQDDLRVVVMLPYLVGHKGDETSTIWGFQNTQYNPMVQESQRDLETKVLDFILNNQNRSGE